MTIKSPLEIENLRILGRSDLAAPLKLYWTASGVEFDFRGSSLELDIEADFAIHEPWISLSLNGNMILRQPLSKGRVILPALRGLDPNQPNHVLLLRETQPMPVDPDCTVILHALRYEGEMAPLPAPKARIEFIGDSITSGEGGMGCPLDTEWLPIWFTAKQGFGVRTGEKLGAEVRILSQSGWGVRSSWDNDPQCNMPAYYEQVCGVVSGGKNACDKPYDFASWPADIVCCVLGCNDQGAINQPEPRVDPVTGVSFKQTVETLPLLEDAMLDFLRKLRRCNPNAKLVWALYENLDAIITVGKNAVKRFLAEGGKDASFVVLPPVVDSGARFHPGKADLERYADVLAQVFKGLL